MEDQLETLKKIVRIQDIRKSMDHGQIVTYRFGRVGAAAEQWSAG